jgi:hypothetical protein
MDRADPVGVEEDTFGQRGLARVDVGADADSSAAPASASVAGSAASTPIAHSAPAGTIQGTPFAPDTVRLEETSDGTILELTKLKADRKDRIRCSGTEMSAERELQVYLSEAIVKSGEGEMELGSFSGTDIPFNNPVPGKAKIKITKKDAWGFRAEGTLEIASDDGKWKLSGPFSGEYCPTIVVRREHPEPLGGHAWTEGAFDAAKLGPEPVQAILAGTPTPIKLVTLYERKKHDGKQLHRLVFYTRERKDPCAERPYGGGGELVKEPNDSFAIDLEVAPVKGGVVSGRNSSKEDKTGQIDGADLRAFEPDRYRSWIYSQYFSASVAFDELDDKTAKGRAYLALPDSGKSMLVGAFSATRCPPEP